MSFNVSLRSYLPSIDTKRGGRKSHKKKVGKQDDPVQPNISMDLSIHSSPWVISNEFTPNESENDSEPDRSKPLWKITPSKKSDEEPKQENVFDSLKPKITIWDEIMMEYEDARQEYQALLEISKPYEPVLPISSKLSAVQYLEKCIFPLLCPILEETLVKAKEAECLMIQKCRFNGLDHISELLWNRNPLYPCRNRRRTNIFDIPFVIIWLHYNPRPIYPLSWLWSKNEAIIVLQTYIRRYFVCKEPECSEMRQFWKIIKAEQLEEKEAIRSKKIEEIEIMFNNIFDKLVADVVFEAEWKLYGCRCIQKPCRCECKCKKWCKCCTCYKAPAHTKEPCTCIKLKDDTDS